MASSLQTASDRTSLAAAVLAAAAFFTSLFQLILQYISSGESRNKCNRAAINFSSKDVKHRWSFTNWKLKVYYPELDMSCKSIIEAMARAWEHGIDYSSIADFRDNDKMKWRILQATDYTGWRHVSDELTALKFTTDEGNERFVTTADLNWRQYVRFWWWRLRHRPKLIRRPRASWSEILTSFGIRETRSLRRRVIDADTIPSNLDVPPQYVELSQLGILCIVMGFKDITIDTERRTFHATGPSRSITTQELQGYGKVLRFDGDTFQINYSVVRGNNVEQTFTLAFMSLGTVYFGRFTCAGLYLPIDLLSEVIRLDRPDLEFQERMVKYISSEENEDGVSGNMPKEASCFQDRMTELQSSWADKGRSIHSPPDSPGRPFAISEKADNDTTGISRNVDDPEYQAYFESKVIEWQVTTWVKVPTIFLAAMFCSVHGWVVGFPSRQLLKPFLPWWQLEAKDIYQNLDANFTPSMDFQRAIRFNEIPWVNNETDWLSTGSGAATGGLYSWGICSFTTMYNELPDSVKHGIHQFTCRSTKPDNEDLSSSENGHATSTDRTQSIFMPHTLKLLRDFRPQHWKDKVMPKQRYNVRHQYTAEHFLWAQIILIDMAIRLIVTGDTEKIDSDTKDQGADSQQEEYRRGERRDRSETWDLRAIPLVNALADSWKSCTVDDDRKQPTQGESIEKWDLVPGLKKFDVVRCAEGGKLPQVRERLVYLLKIRALFVVALLILGPDTSDVYLANDEGILMPII